MNTVNDAVEQTRILLQDTVEPYRYPTAQLLMYLNNGLYEMKRIRPDIWIDNLDSDLPQYGDNVTDLATTLPFNQMFFNPLVFFMSGFAELRDDEYTQDSRAAILTASFNSQLTQRIAK